MHPPARIPSTIGPKLTGRCFNRRVVLLAAALIGVVGGGYYWSNHRARASDNNTRNRTMVAVLPFENLTNDPAQEYFSDGMTEETISQLGRLNSQNLGVIARPRR